MNRSRAEIDDAKLRDIILLTWGSRLEEDTFFRLGIDTFSNPCPGEQAWDMQKHGIFISFTGRSGQENKNSAKMCNALGINTAHKDNSTSLHHNAANDTAFMMAMFVAIATLTPKQRSGFESRVQLEMSQSRSFAGQTMEVNRPPTIAATSHVVKGYRPAPSFTPAPTPGQGLVLPGAASPTSSSVTPSGPSGQSLVLPGIASTTSSSTPLQGRRLVLPDAVPATPVSRVVQLDLTSQSNLSNMEWVPLRWQGPTKGLFKIGSDELLAALLSHVSDDEVLQALKTAIQASAEVSPSSLHLVHPNKASYLCRMTLLPPNRHPSRLSPRPIGFLLTSACLRSQPSVEAPSRSSLSLPPNRRPFRQPPRPFLLKCANLPSP